MSSLIPSAPYFLMCDDDCGELHGFIVIPDYWRISIFSKEAGEMQVRMAFKRGIVKSDETLQLLRQIGLSRLPLFFLLLDFLDAVLNETSLLAEEIKRDGSIYFPEGFRHSIN